MRSGDCANMTEKRIELTEWDITLMAWHEAGHAICSKYFPEKKVIKTISIEQDSETLGAMISESCKQSNLTYISCINEIAIALAGRLSEEIFLNEITSSCIHDLDKVQAIALRMVCGMGMGKRTGKITWLCPDNDSNGLLLFSEDQRNDIYADIKDILQESEQTARNILQSHSSQVRKLAEILLERKTILGEELSKMLED